MILTDFNKNIMWWKLLVKMKDLRKGLFMEDHDSIKHYLERDETGNIYCQNTLPISANYNDESNMYKNYKDFSDWLDEF